MSSYIDTKAKTPPQKPAASNNTAEAFKNYLSAAAPSLSAKDFQEGAPIPTSQIDKDIEVLVNQIAQCSRFGFPTDEREKKLAALVQLRASVKGKTWPTAKQQLINDMSTLSKLAGCKHTNTVQHTNAVGSTYTYCNDCYKSWLTPLEASKPLSLKNYSKKKHEWLQTVKPERKFEEVKMTVGKVEVSQNMLARIAVMSNCNVTVYRCVGYALESEFKLVCGSCKHEEIHGTQILLSTVDGVPQKIAEFCNAHKHAATVQATEGRMFIEE